MLQSRSKQLWHHWHPLKSTICQRVSINHILQLAAERALALALLAVSYIFELKLSCVCPMESLSFDTCWKVLVDTVAALCRREVGQATVFVPAKNENAKLQANPKCYPHVRVRVIPNWWLTLLDTATRTQLHTKNYRTWEQPNVLQRMFGGKKPSTLGLSNSNSGIQKVLEISKNKHLHKIKLQINII